MKKKKHKQKKKQKKYEFMGLIWKIIIAIWILIGAFIIFWIISFFIKLQEVNNLGLIVGVILLAVGLYMLMIFFAITLAVILIRYAIKLIIKRKNQN